MRLWTQDRRKVENIRFKLKHKSKSLQNFDASNLLPLDRVEGRHSSDGHANHGEHSSSCDHAEEQVLQWGRNTGLSCLCDLGHHGSGKQSQAGQTSNILVLWRSAAESHHTDKNLLKQFTRYAGVIAAIAAQLHTIKCEPRIHAQHAETYYLSSSIGSFQSNSNKSNAHNPRASPSRNVETTDANPHMINPHRYHRLTTLNHLSQTNTYLITTLLRFMATCPAILRGEAAAKDKPWRDSVFPSHTCVAAGAKVAELTAAMLTHAIADLIRRGVDDSPASERASREE